MCTGGATTSGRPLNIVHRDLNPANVIVSYDGAVKLIDFGIAKAATKVYETRTGVIKGTYGYIAPEQLTQAATVDHRADVFALGVLMYEMCLGDHPFDVSDEPNLLDRILGARYKRPRQVVPNFPPFLDRLIARCLAPHPEGRPDDVASVMAEIVNYMGQRGLVMTMSDLARLSNALVPDKEGATPLQPLRVSQLRGPSFGTSSEPPEDQDERPTVVGRDPTMKVADRRVAQPIQPAVINEPDVVASMTVPVHVGDVEGLYEESGDTEQSLSDVLTDPSPMRLPEQDEPSIQVAPEILEEEIQFADPLPAAVHPGASPADSYRPPPPPAPITNDKFIPETESTGRRAFLIAGSALLIGGVGIGAFVAARAIGGSSRDDELEPGDEPEAIVDAGSPAIDTAPEPSPIELQVVSQPEDARIALDDKELKQRTPATLEIPADAKRVRVRVSKDGFRTEEREVQASVGNRALCAHATDRGRRGGRSRSQAEGQEKARTAARTARPKAPLKPPGLAGISAIC